jgi:hypothetical protein
MLNDQQWGIARALCLAMLFGLVAATIACSGVIGVPHDNAGDPLHLGVTPGPLGSTTPQTIQLRLGSEPSDRFVSLFFTIPSIQTTNSGGENLEFLLDPISVEFTHSATVTEPVFLGQIYQDTYSTLIVPGMTGRALFYDVDGNLVTQSLNVPPQILPYSFVLGADPLVLNIDLDIRQSFTIADPGTVVVNDPAVITASIYLPDPGTGQPETGSIIFLTGTVLAVDGQRKTISLQPSSGSQMEFSYDDLGGTKFVDCDPSILTDAIIGLEASTQSNGIVNAIRVEMISHADQSDELYGFLGGYAPDYINYDLIAEGGVGVNVSTNLIAKNITVDWLAASYSVNTAHLNLDLVANDDLVFDETRAFPGQFVEIKWDKLLVPDSDSTNAGFMQPRMIELQEQLLSGQVSNYVYDAQTQSGTFILSVANDSMIKRMNGGLVSITVRQIPQTYLRESPTFVDGDFVKVRGLVFADSRYSNVNYLPPGSPVAFIMIADRISK